MMGSGSKSQVQVPKKFGFHWVLRVRFEYYFSLLGFEFPPWILGFSGTSTYHTIWGLCLFFFFRGKLLVTSNALPRGVQSFASKR